MRRCVFSVVASRSLAMTVSDECPYATALPSRQQTVQAKFQRAFPMVAREHYTLRCGFNWEPRPREVDRVVEKPEHVPQKTRFRKDRRAVWRRQGRAVKTAAVRDPE